MSILQRTAEGPLTDLLQWLDRQRPVASELRHYIPVESFAEEGRYVVRADLPGIDPDKDIEVTVEGDILTIHGERREESHDSGHSELRYGSFTRSLRLPPGAEAADVTARYDAGVLEVSVPMAEAASKPITIAVQRAAGTES